MSGFSTRAVDAAGEGRTTLAGGDILPTGNTVLTSLLDMATTSLL